MPVYNDKTTSTNYTDRRDHARVLRQNGVGIDPWARSAKGFSVIRKAKLRRARGGYMVLETPPLSPRGKEAL